MSDRKKSSSELVYRALYDDEEYLPWGGEPTNSRQRQTSQQLNFSPTWGHGECPRNQLDSGTLSCKDARQEKSPKKADESKQTDRGISHQWKARAMELEIAMTGAPGSRLLSPGMMSGNMDMYNSGNSQTGYPSWKTDNDMSNKRNVTDRHNDCHSPKRTENWNFNNLYGGSNNTVPCSTDNLTHRLPLNNSRNQFYSSIADERYFNSGEAIPTWNKHSRDLPHEPVVRLDIADESRSKNRRRDEPSTSNNVVESVQNDNAKEREPTTATNTKSSNTLPPSPVKGKTAMESSKRKMKTSKKAKNEEVDQEEEQIKRPKKKKRKDTMSFLPDS